MTYTDEHGREYQPLTGIEHYKLSRRMTKFAAMYGITIVCLNEMKAALAQLEEDVTTINKEER